MATLGDIFKITVVYVHPNGQRPQQTLYYVVTTAGSAGAGHVHAAFLSLLVTPYLGALNEDLSITFRQVINGMNNGDFLETEANLDGTRTGISLPSALTTIFRSARDAPGDRYSWTRPPFGSGSDLEDGGVWKSTFNTTLADYAGDLSEVLTPTGDDILTPCQITGGFKLGEDPTLARLLGTDWSYGLSPHWLDRREPDFEYQQGS